MFSHNNRCPGVAVSVTVLDYGPSSDQLIFGAIETPGHSYGCFPQQTPRSAITRPCVEMEARSPQASVGPHQTLTELP
jgi:hypothetical protein